MRKLFLWLFLLFFFIETSLPKNNEAQRFLKKRGIEVGLMKKQTEEIIKEEKAKSFSITPLKVIPQDSTVYRVSFSKTGDYLAFSTKLGKIEIYNLKWKKVKEEKVSEKPIYYVSFHPSKDIITYGGRDGKIIIYDIKKDRIIHIIFELETPIADAKFSPDGTVLCAAHLGEYGLTFYDTENYKELMNIKSPQGGLYYISFSPDNELLAVAGRNRKISIFPLGRDKPSVILNKHTFLTLCVEFSPDNKFLASAGADAQLFLWEKKKNKINPNPVFSWTHGSWVTSLKFFKKYLFTTSKDGKVRIFDYINKKFLGVFKVSKSPVFSIDIDRKGGFLAVGTKEEGVKIYELEKILEKIES